MIKLRMLNENGIEAFRSYIQNLKQDPSTPRPDLNSNIYSEEFMPVAEVDENKTFTTRLEIGKYVQECFEATGVKRENVVGSLHMWTWLAYIWFDQITDNRKRLKAPEKYICSQDYKYYYRHLISFPYNIYSLYGEDYSKLFLDTKPYIHNDFAEQLASTGFIISNFSLIKAAYALYWDTQKNEAKKGSTNRKKPGNIRRFVKVINQIDLTYDVYNTPEMVLGLLPHEFDMWMSTVTNL